MAEFQHAMEAIVTRTSTAIKAELTTSIPKLVKDEVNEKFTKYDDRFNDEIKTFSSKLSMSMAARILNPSRVQPSSPVVHNLGVRHGTVDVPIAFPGQLFIPPSQGFQGFVIQNFFA